MPGLPGQDAQPWRIARYRRFDDFSPLFATILKQIADFLATIYSAACILCKTRCRNGAKNTPVAARKTMPL